MDPHNRSWGGSCHITCSDCAELGYVLSGTFKQPSEGNERQLWIAHGFLWFAPLTRLRHVLIGWDMPAWLGLFCLNYLSSQSSWAVGDWIDKRKKLWSWMQTFLFYTWMLSCLGHDVDMLLMKMMFFLYTTTRRPWGRMEFGMRQERTFSFHFVLSFCFLPIWTFWTQVRFYKLISP